MVAQVSDQSRQRTIYCCLVLCTHIVVHIVVVAGLSSRLSYTFSRTNASLQEDISGSTGWQAVQRHNKKNLYSLVKQISDGHTEQKSMKSVKGIVKYPLYLGLPATGDVRADIVRSDIAGLSLQKTVDLSWSYDGLSSICRNDQAGSPPPDQTCAAGDVYRNASLGADLGWFTLKSSCPLGDTDFQGLCFILANDKIAAAGNELTSTLLASADSRKSCTALPHLMCTSSGSHY